MSDQLGRVYRTPRGFQYIDFVDLNGEDCELLQSSLAGGPHPGSAAIRLIVLAGTNKKASMHLDATQVAQLVATLGNWLLTGSFEPPFLPDCGHELIFRDAAGNERCAECLPEIVRLP